jgi:predicted transcriptional regulator
MSEQESSLEVEQAPTIFEKAEKVEQVGLLYLKGYRPSEIADLENISRATVNSYIDQYKSWINKKVDDDPYFLERVQHNTLKALNEVDEISKEAWETVEIATREGMVSARTQAIKLCLDIATKKAQLNQLLGGNNRADAEYIARMQRAETVNQLVSGAVRDVVAHCESCSEKLRPILREVFAMMSEEQQSDNNVVDAEIIDD